MLRVLLNYEATMRKGERFCIARLIVRLKYCCRALEFAPRKFIGVYWVMILGSLSVHGETVDRPMLLFCNMIFPDALTLARTYALDSWWDTSGWQDVGVYYV